ncbi:DUF302 domain-containing protein [Algoriphagus halophytocola]|uniref:DUF302 domain-containing protein n=1 Tax=Algoriphagus halophytocola TaxID=2991499 RepID=A0ABY6MHP8_9BACT|nr:MULTISPECIES: DUF302 domain-containing protein [unclassified Algoriphagus]UZD23316.1 DUF302 domain-containing protein [Algoriphagus sp. TR-M5]WBL44611.1 DUF302 domain-containing protein [Algoriphagus sp. TR-M9]
MSYFQKKDIVSNSIAELRTHVESALKAEGFGILTEIDIQATMKKKLDKHYAPYLILGACNPVFADKVLQAEPNIGALLPCNVTIREIEKGKYEVAVMDPAAAMAAVENPEIEPLAGEVRDKLLNALKQLG